MNKKIKVVVKIPNKDAEVKVIDSGYETLSDIVGGLIDIISLPMDNNIDIVCNDEGLLMSMNPNIVIPEYESVLVGPIVFQSYNIETGDAMSLTDEQIDTVIKYCNCNKVNDMALEDAYYYSKFLSMSRNGVDDNA